MAEHNVITSLLDDLCQEQPIHTALCLGQNLSPFMQNLIQWEHFNVKPFLNLPFQKRYDLAFVILDSDEFDVLSTSEKTQLLVKLRDLMAKRIVVVSHMHEQKLLRALGFTQLLDPNQETTASGVWQFNILSYKQVPDWLNAKYWANPENWNKFRW